MHKKTLPSPDDIKSLIKLSIACKTFFSIYRSKFVLLYMFDMYMVKLFL